MIRRDAQQLFLMTSDDILANISNIYHPITFWRVFFLRKLHKQYVWKTSVTLLLPFLRPPLSAFKVELHICTHISTKQNPFFAALSGQFGGGFCWVQKKKATHWGCEKCPAGNSKNLLKKRMQKKKTDLTRLYVCNQLHTSLLHAIYDVTNPVVSRWISNAMCVHIYIYIKYKGAEWLSTVFPLHSYDSVLKSG